VTPGTRRPTAVNIGGAGAIEVGYSRSSVRNRAHVTRCPPLPVAVSLTVLSLAAPAAAEELPAPEAGGPRWSVTLGGGALVPLGAMRDSHRDTLLAGLRLGVRARIGLGAQLAVDYSPLPRRDVLGQRIDTTYGTAALLPSWTIGRGAVRLQLAAGGGVAVEEVAITAGNAPDRQERAVAPVALGQLGVELHVTRGGGIVLLGGAARTYGDLASEYAWALGGLMLEF
jgi:hypothetical protein